MNLAEFRLSNYSSLRTFVTSVRSNTSNFEHKNRNRSVIRHMEVREVHQNFVCTQNYGKHHIDPKLCADSEYKLINVLKRRNQAWHRKSEVRDDLTEQTRCSQV